MPRPKKINTKNNIMKISDITKQDIDNSNCLSVEIHISDLDKRMWYLVENFYKLTVIGERKRFSIDLKHSWKGLIQLLLSILYCKVGAKIVILQAEYNFVFHVKVEHDFKLLKSATIARNPILEKLYLPKSYKPLYTR